jgi:hypothetical protein
MRRRRGEYLLLGTARVREKGPGEGTVSGSLEEIQRWN